MLLQEKKDSEESLLVPSPNDKESLRAFAVKQIDRKRHFVQRVVGASSASVVLVVIWAINEYHNAGGWPADGFSQSSSIPHVWNIWIIYPVLGLLLLVAIDAWFTFARKPISEHDIQREINRLTKAR